MRIERTLAALAAAAAAAGIMNKGAQALWTV
jgi:hypothetical protein